MSAPGQLVERVPRRATSSLTSRVIPFTKMHGAGNDFVCVDGISEPAVSARDDWARVARAVCDRHTGIGADGLILILPPQPPPHTTPAAAAHVRMRIFNADGSEAQMCGNGLRCVAKYAVEHGLATARPLLVQMPTSVAAVDYATSPGGGVERATVDLGEPSFVAADLPVRVEALPALL
ncbi:MAG: diaminopimelate epimerase, partial [Planctomycetota bacterium]